MKIQRLKTLQGKLRLPPDRAQAGATAILAALGTDSTTVSPWPDFGDYRKILLWLEAAEIPFTLRDGTLIVEGQGGRPLPPLSRPVPVTSHSGINLIAASWFTATPGVPVRFSGKIGWLRSLEKELREIPSLDLTVRSGELEAVRKETLSPLPHRGSSPARRNDALLQAVIAGRPFSWKAKWVIDDPLSPLIREMGGAIAVEEVKKLDDRQSEGLEHLQELLKTLQGDSHTHSGLERRLLRFSRKKPENFSEWNYSPAGPLHSAKITLGADPSLAALCTLLATHLPESDLELEQVIITPSRAGFFSALGRLGGEIKRSRERKPHGEQSADLRIRPAELTGRKFSAEQIRSLGGDYPLLAVAAALSQDETLFRGLSGDRGDRLAALTDTLRNAGLEVGEFEDGVVFRGNTELDSASFTSNGNTALALACVALSFLGHGHSALDAETVEVMDDLWPGWHTTLRELSDET